MTNIKAKCLLVGLYCAFSWPTSAAGQDGALSRDGMDLTALLAVTPDVSSLKEFPPIRFINYRAAEAASGVAMPESWAAIQAMDKQTFDSWASAMSRIDDDPLDVSHAVTGATVARAMPTLPPSQAGIIGGLPNVLGVEFFAIDSALAMGMPRRKVLGQDYDPQFVVILGGGPDLSDMKSLRAALTVRDFDVREVSGVPVWNRSDDSETKLGTMALTDVFGRPWIDPFGINQGAAAKIAVLPGILAGSSRLSATALMIETVQGVMPSLADAPDFRAAVAAITDQETFNGRLVQAMFVGRSHFTAERVSLGRLGPYSSPSRRAEFIKWLLETRRGRLPQYRLVALADRQEGEEEVAVLAMVYDDSRSAEAAATVIADRMADYEPVRYHVPIAEMFDLRTSTHVYQARDAEQAIAVMSLSHTPQQVSETGLTRRGKLFETLAAGIVQSDADYLVVNP